VSSSRYNRTRLIATDEESVDSATP
jgi:hypothetical protein